MCEQTVIRYSETHECLVVILQETGSGGDAENVDFKCNTDRRLMLQADTVGL